LVRPEKPPTCIPETDPAIVAMRDLYMKTGQGFLLVFSIASLSSLAELAGLRDEIIRIKDDENVPIVICGNKADLEDQRTVPRTKGFSLSQRWGAPYYESSARTRSKRTFVPKIPVSAISWQLYLILVGLIKRSECR
jgi:small GTP-binding protein